MVQVAVLASLAFPKGERQTLGFIPGVVIGVGFLVGGVVLLTVGVPRLRSARVGSWRWLRELMRVASGGMAVLMGVSLSTILVLREAGILEPPS